MIESQSFKREVKHGVCCEAKLGAQFRLNFSHTVDYVIVDTHLGLALATCTSKRTLPLTHTRTYKHTHTAGLSISCSAYTEAGF